MRFLFAAVAAAAACSGRPPQPALIQQQASHGIAPLDGDGDRAYAVEARGLVEHAETGASQVIRIPPIHWCAVDAKARVVWFTTALGLELFDLDTRAMIPLVLDDLAGIGVIIDHGDARLAPDDIGGYPVAARLVVSDAPALVVDEPCGDPTTFVCYDEQGRALPQLVEYRERAATLRLEDPPYVASLAARGAAGSLDARAKPPAFEPRADQQAFCGWASGRWPE